MEAKGYRGFLKTEKTAPVKASPVKVDQKANAKRILFQNYFQIITNDEYRLSAVCKFCGIVAYGLLDNSSNFEDHLMVCMCLFFSRVNFEFFDIFCLG